MSPRVGHPRDLVADAVADLGQTTVVGWLGDLLSGRAGADDPDQPDITRLGGTTGWPAYWTRTWGGRGMLYTWDESLIPDVVAALEDEHWRVREMAAKVIRHREVGEAADPLVPLVADPVERVRVHAVKALALVGEHEHLPVLESALDDESRLVRAAAESALATVRVRLDLS